MNNCGPSHPTTINNYYYSVDSHDTSTTTTTNSHTADSHDASFDARNPLGSLANLGGDLGMTGAAAASAGGDQVAADAMHGISSLDLSDDGAALHALPISDIMASHLDLDHLTSNLNLFDVCHVDTSTDTHHA